jgi:hypothetical protein
MHVNLVILYYCVAISISDIMHLKPSSLLCIRKMRLWNRQITIGEETASTLLCAVRTMKEEIETEL